MLLNWLNAREATEVGTALADDFVLQTASSSSGMSRKQSRLHTGAKDLQGFLQRFLQRVDRDARPLDLNVFKRAKLANSFKWRLLEKGIDREIVEELTRALVLRLSANQTSGARGGVPDAGSTQRAAADNVPTLLAKAEVCIARSDFAEATTCYQDVLRLDPRHAIAHNNLGAALVKLGRYQEAESEFRRAIGIRESYPDAHSNLGSVLRVLGRTTEAEAPLRRALKLRPTFVEAQSGLGLTLILLARLSEAKECFDKVLRVAPRHAEALVGTAQVAALEGHFDESEATYRRALAVDPKMPSAWAALGQLRKMTPADRDWLGAAEEIAASGLAALEEANVRFSIAKYYDDVGDFARAFRYYQRANELQKSAADSFDRDDYTRSVDDLIRVYTREALSTPHAGASDSTRPVFVVGMPRSGTSLVEQIIASHPRAHGAGELGFWAFAARKHESTVRHELPAEPLTRRLAEGYLRVLEGHSPDALRVVDKSPYNFERLGLIHAVFPKARMIYLRRDPIDTCLSCYFQQLSPTLNFKLDLTDLAHYFRQQHRAVEHWRATLPPGTLLDVPYAELVANQEAWSRKILEFLGLDWDERCLNFHQTQRPVVTASYRQVRQKMYQSSVGRWRNYEKFISPLLSLKDLS